MTGFRFGHTDKKAGISALLGVAATTARAACGGREPLVIWGVFFGKKKPRERFYLLPGQGGKNYYLKQRRLLLWAVAAALVFGGVLSVALWWMSRP